MERYGAFRVQPGEAVEVLGRVEPGFGAGA